MQHGQTRTGHLRFLGYWLLAPVALAAGCSGFWDTVTRRDFQVQDLLVRPDPLEVLAKSDDGSQRAVALRSLDDPLQNGGTQEQQNFNLKILTAAVTTERDPYCRISAIKALGRYKNKQAADALKEAYLQDLKYTSDVNSQIRQQALLALAETGQDSALELLIRVAKEPPADGSHQDRQETVDRRRAAVRGLGKFNQPEATTALVHVLRTEQDVSLGHWAQKSLQNATGKDVPPDPVAWERELQLAPRPPVAQGPAPAPKAVAQK